MSKVSSPHRWSGETVNMAQPWDKVFAGFPFARATEDVRRQHKELWERIRMRGGVPTEPEEEELNRLFMAMADRHRFLKTNDNPNVQPSKKSGNTQGRDFMSTDTQEASRQRKFVEGMNKLNNTQPPIVYFILGCICLAFWALGTSTQVLTSEAWMMHQSMSAINFNAFGQLYDTARGQMPDGMLVPFLFGWGVQLALVVASVGVELPKRPKWRWHLAVWSCAILIISNSCGDFASSAQYGFWGQLGFSAVIFFLTFVMMLFVIMAFKHAFALAKLHQ